MSNELACPIDDWIATVNKLAKVQEQLQQEINDSCQVDTDVRVEARKVLPADKVDGDSHAVPDVVEIVAMLVKEVERLKRQLSESVTGNCEECGMMLDVCDCMTDSELNELTGA